MHLQSLVVSVVVVVVVNDVVVVKFVYYYSWVGNAIMFCLNFFCDSPVLFTHSLLIGGTQQSLHCGASLLFVNPTFLNSLLLPPQVPPMFYFYVTE
jgi:hypothetical protein